MSTFLFTLLWQQEGFVLNALELSRTGSENKFFHVVYEKKIDSSVILNRLRKLPGISRVIQKEKAVIKKKTNSILKNLDINSSSKYFNIDPKVLTVFMETGIGSRAEELIQEFTRKLIGKDDVSLSPVHDPKTKSRALKDKVKFTVMKSRIGIFALLVILWGVLSFQFVMIIQKRSYLIEKFQRKKFVRVKIFSCGILAVFMISTLLSFLIAPPPVAKIIGCLVFISILSLVNLKKWSVEF
ncbi:MAG: hypothetical protein HOE90_19860 [Bacteriovoracaceae bacterium]|nr:hypothetical protein [Bacteriovoracaceae bacterium]